MIMVSLISYALSQPFLNRELQQSGKAFIFYNSYFNYLPFLRHPVVLGDLNPNNMLDNFYTA